jgi:hypothetical protein
VTSAVFRSNIISDHFAIWREDIAKIVMNKTVIRYNSYKYLRWRVLISPSDIEIYIVGLELGHSITHDLT